LEKFLESTIGLILVDSSRLEEIKKTLSNREWNKGLNRCDKIVHCQRKVEHGCWVQVFRWTWLGFRAGDEVIQLCAKVRRGFCESLWSTRVVF
jgi:hypothetical protein